MLNAILSTELLASLPTSTRYLLLAYLGFKAIDMVTGILKTLKNDNYKSAIMKNGIITWVAEMVSIIFVVILDMILGINYVLCGFTLCLFVYKEAGSILENLLQCGVQLPTQISEKLEIFNVENKTNILTNNTPTTDTTEGE